jgi:cell division protein FtsW
MEHTATTQDSGQKYFLLSLSVILIIGLIMVYSSSYIYAKENFGSSTHFLFKHILFLFSGVTIAWILTKTKLQFWITNSYFFHILAILFLVTTFTPMGSNINGSTRWVNIMGFSLQPGEFIKYSTVLAATKYFSDFKSLTPKKNAIRSLLFIVPLMLLLAQPDFGTFSITLAVITYACFLSDFPRKWFYSSLLAGGVLFGMLLVAAPYRVKRLLVFLDPWADPHNAGFQIIQSYLAFANGHILGQGIGNSNEKLFYLPEAYNDFIFSVIGEEMGFIGVTFIVVIFFSLILLGFKLATRVKSQMNQKLVCTIIFLIGLQAFLNMGVVLGLLPTKGLNLPFISYGGSSLIANLIGIGLVYAALNSKSQVEIPKTRPITPTNNINRTHTMNTNTFNTRPSSPSASDLAKRKARLQELRMKYNRQSSTNNGKTSYFQSDSRFNQQGR